MKIYLFVFSGTGNTYITADFIARVLNESGAEVMVRKIEKGIEGLPDLSDADHIIIGYPVYAFNPPWPVMKFVRGLPPEQGMKVSIFKTAGEPFYWNRSSSAQMIRAMEKKGYNVENERHILMPYNIMFRYPDTLAKQMYFAMQKASAEFAQNVLGMKRERISYSIFGRIVSFLFRIQWPGARFNGRLYTADGKKCTLCQKCVRSCPTGNISVKNGKIHFDGKCAMCMRCVQICPEQAINIGLLRPWTVREGYDFERLAQDDSIPADFVNYGTHGYFRLFRKFFGVK